MFGRPGRVSILLDLLLGCTVLGGVACELEPGGTETPVVDPDFPDAGAGKPAPAPGNGGSGGRGGSGGEGRGGGGGASGPDAGPQTGGAGGAPGRGGSGGGGSGGEGGSGGSRPPQMDAMPPPPGPDAGAGPGVCPAAPTNYCEALPTLPNAPTIDGQIACSFPLRPIPVEGWTGTTPLPAGRSARYVAAARPDGLYVFVEVTSPTRRPFADPQNAHCGDAVEIYVDADGGYSNAPAYDDPGTVQLTVQAPGPSQAEAKSGWIWRHGVSRGRWNGDFRAFARADGYAVEAFIRAADLGLGSWALRPGGRIGLDLAIDVGASTGGGDCPRIGQYALRISQPVRVPQHNLEACVLPWCTVTAFCRPEIQ